MNVKQAYPLANQVFSEVTGKTVVLAEDLSDIVTIGKDVTALPGWMDNYVGTVFNVIGQTLFLDRPYEGRTPSMLKRSNEYGSIIRKIDAEVGDFTANESWDLQDGAVYEQDKFTKPNVRVKLFNQALTYELANSIAEMQIKESLTSADELVRFFSMIETMIRNKDTKTADSLMQRAINNFIAETIYDEYAGAALSSKSGVRAVNLFYLYKQDFPSTTLTASTCLKDPDFLRYATQKIKLYPDRMRDYSTLFNIEGKERHTPASMLHTIFLDEFVSDAGTYLANANGQFLTENLQLPNAEKVSYWQGSGTDYAFSSTSSINVTSSENHSVEASGIIGVMFDDEAAFISNLDRHVRSHVNDRAEFVNFWYKTKFGLVNDFQENFVVFFVA